MTKKFWKKVNKCKHEWDENYYETYDCATDYCVAKETRCKKCGAYSVRCGCGFETGLSGWNHKRYMREQLKHQFIEKRRKTTAL